MASTPSLPRLPRVTFVLGKGGVGRSTVAAALGLTLASRGERTCVFGWTVSDPIGPWFGVPPTTLMPTEVAPRLHVGNYRLDDTLELYFVRHLHLPRFYEHVIRGDYVRRLIAAAPGLAEVYFVGHLWWLTTLAGKEANLHFDRVVVDAPATGHGASLFDLPSLLSSLHASGLLALEAERVRAMMSDPDWTGALVVALPDELSVDETLELVPRLRERMSRPPLAVLINRTVPHVGTGGASVRDALDGRVSAVSLDALATLGEELGARARFEATLRARVRGACDVEPLGLREQLLNPGAHEPLDIVRALAAEVRPWVSEAR
jgi:hypothetical protein